MSKITLNSVGSIPDNPTSAAATINANNTTIQTAFDKTLSRDGTSPNTMGSNLDMNGNQILNLPIAVDPTSPVRLQEVGNAPTYAANALASATAAASSATSASTSASSATTSASTATTQASTATTQASAASTSATNAANSASAASTSATNAAASATSASGSATTATTQASNASTSATTATTQAGNASTSATNASTSATNASTSATNAANSATSAQNFVNGLSGTSTTSVTIGTGAQSFTANTGKNWAAGQFLTISSNANSANYMHGSITSYNSGTGALVVNVLDIGGAGTKTDWNITVSGTQGPTGPSGSVGTTGSPVANNFATFFNATTVQGVAITGLVKGNGASAPAAATANTDYLTPPAGTSILKGNSGGALANATSGTDYCPATSGTSVLKASAGGTAATTTADALTIGTVELGAATDTTLSRASAGVLAVEGVNLTPNIPITSKSVAYTVVLADANTAILHPTADNVARTFTIDSNANVAYPVGTQLTFFNQINTVTIAITTDTLTLAGAGTTGSRTLAANGIATATKLASTSWVISGIGLT